MQVGIYAKEVTRRAPDIRGGMFPVEFTIIDRLDSPQAIAAAAQAAADGTPTAQFKKPNSPYSVKILLSVRTHLLRATSHQCLKLDRCAVFPAASSGGHAHFATPRPTAAVPALPGLHRGC